MSKGRTINPKAASLRHASMEVKISRGKLKSLAANGEVSCINSDPWQFDIEVLRDEIEKRKNRILAEIKNTSK